MFLRYQSYLAKLTLESHPDKALVFGLGSTIFHGGWDVLWAELGPSHKAMEVKIYKMPDRTYIKILKQWTH